MGFSVCAHAAAPRQIPAIPHPYGLPHAQAFLRARLEQPSSGPPAWFAIRSAAGDLCGNIDLQLDGSGSGELGYWLAADLWGRGIMSTVIPCFLDYARSELRLKRMTASALCSNAASLRLLRRNGFRSLGVEVGLAQTRQGPRDVELFELRCEP